MAHTTVKASNVFEPAPRWFRILKKVLYTLTGSSVVTGTLQRFGVSDADCLLIMGWLVLVGELLSSILANGETYANAAHINQPVIINEVTSLPDTGIIGQWYHYNNNYWYWTGFAWVALYEDLGPGGGTNPPPTGLPPVKS